MIAAIFPIWVILAYTTLCIRNLIDQFQLTWWECVIFFFLWWLWIILRVIELALEQEHEVKRRNHK